MSCSIITLKKSKTIIAYFICLVAINLKMSKTIAAIIGQIYKKEMITVIER